VLVATTSGGHRTGSRRSRHNHAHRKIDMIRRSVSQVVAAALPRRRLGRFAVATWTVLMLGFGPSLATVRAATDTVVIENRTNSSTLWIATMQRGEAGCLTDDGVHGDYWSVSGWYEVLPGRSATFHTTHNGYYYYYGKAFGGSGRGWGGKP